MQKRTLIATLRHFPPGNKPEEREERQVTIYLPENHQKLSILIVYVEELDRRGCFYKERNEILLRDSRR